MNLGSLKDHFFKEMKSVVFDLTTGGLAIKAPKDRGVFSLRFDADGAPELVQNPIESLSTPMPAFAMRTSIDNIKIGDIIQLQDGAVPAFVVGVEDGKIAILRTTGSKSTVVPPTNLLFGGKGVMVVKNFFGDAQNADGMQQMLPFMLLQGEKGEQTDLTHLMLMQQMMGGNSGMKGMMPMMMMAGMGSGKTDLSQIMMLQAMSGGGFGSMFGGPTKDDEIKILKDRILALEAATINRE